MQGIAIFSPFFTKCFTDCFTFVFYESFHEIPDTNMGVSIGLVHNRNNEKNKDGRYTVNIRVTIDRIPKYLSIKHFPRLRKADWNEAKERVKDCHPYHYELNESLASTLKTLRDFVARCLKERKPITHDSIRACHERGSSALGFSDFARKHVRGLKLDTATKKHYSILMDKLDAFSPGMLFSDLDRAKLEAFITYLQAWYANNSLRNRIFKLRKLYEAACKLEGIQPDYFLFKDLGVKAEKAKRHPLSPEQIALWVSSDMSAYPELEMWRDVFTFQLRTGMYYSDVKKSKRSTELKTHGGKPYLDGSRFKNDNQFIVPLDLYPEPLGLLEKWDTGTEAFFPGLISGDKYNEKLKEIAAIIGLPDLTNKVARHSFSDDIIRRGVPRALLSRMLGHSKEETTSEYYNVNVGLLFAALDQVHKKSPAQRTGD